uniref:G2 and S-phase expressed 1 n=1 Tax=Lynx canadensis TaxID=61383 RepID=A0A667H1I7_LYNCA
MEVPKKDDILLLADEKFDFDLSLSSSSANEDDEVFFGPVGHKERCVAASLELNPHVPEEPLLPGSEGHFTWSPLTGEKFVEVYTEAHLLAFQIESKSKNKAAQAARPEDLWSQSVERFIQESKLKINLFEKEMEMRKSPRSLKRETYYLSDSPLRAPLSQTPLGAASAQAGQAQTQGPLHSPRSSLPVEPGAAPPPNQAGPQKKVISQLVRPRASSVRGKTIHAAAEQLGPKRTLLKPSGCAGGLSRKSSSSGSVSGGISSVCASPATCRGEPAESAMPKSCRAQRPYSCTSVGRVVVHSTPAGHSSGPASPGHLSGMTTPVSTRRGSALPTPASRRLSSLPRVTPKTVPRALASPVCVSALRLSSELRKKCAVRAAPTRASRSEAASGRQDSSSDGSCSPPSAVPQALNFSPEKSDLAVPKSITAEGVPAAAQPPEDTRPREAILVDLRLEQLAIAPKAEGPALVSPPLVDLGGTPEASVAPGSEGRPLIDLLINTPDVNRTTASKPLHEVAQLIDLTSPLIQLSPEADKENVDSPLLKF